MALSLFFSAFYLFSFQFLESLSFLLFFFVCLFSITFYFHPSKSVSLSLLPSVSFCPFLFLFVFLYFFVCSSILSICPFLFLSFFMSASSSVCLSLSCSPDGCTTVHIAAVSLSRAPTLAGLRSSVTSPHPGPLGCPAERDGLYE